MRKLLLMSSSSLHGYGYMEFAKEPATEFFRKYNVQEILFVPYAVVKEQEDYTNKVRSVFGNWGFKIKGLNEVDNPIAAIDTAQAIFIGGGNTFHLLKSLQDKNLFEPIRRRVLVDSIPFMGSSAGTNVATVSINTTNDMPIVHCSSLAALALVPFNINPHYLDADPDSTHKGETRETRINEYHDLPGPIPPVLGLREGTYVKVEGNLATLGGIHPCRLFVQSQEPKELPTGTDVSFLLNTTPVKLPGSPPSPKK